MALYDITGVKGDSLLAHKPLVKVQRSSFAAEGIQERAHLQAALRDHVGLIDENLYVISEEFGDFEGGAAASTFFAWIANVSWW